MGTATEVLHRFELAKLVIDKKSQVIANLVIEPLLARIYLHSLWILVEDFQDTSSCKEWIGYEEVANGPIQK